MSRLPDNATGRLEVVYASDEHVAIKARGDYAALCPKWQTLAAVADGVIDASDHWTVTSAAVDFEARGVAVGNVAVFSKPANLFNGRADLFAVEAVAGPSLTVRRLGEPAGRGQPPAAQGATGIALDVPTMGAQVEDASFALNAKWGIDPAVPGRRPSDAYDLRVLRRACVLRVLYDAYASDLKGENGEFSTKLRQVVSEMREVDGQLTLRWGPKGDSQPPSSIFSMRLVR